MNGNADNVVIYETDYASYYKTYINLIRLMPWESILSQDNDARRRLRAALLNEAIPEPYAPGKWTVGEILLHCMDTERIFTTRALMLARGEKSEIPGFDHESYAKNALAEYRSCDKLMDDWEALRESTQRFFNSLHPTVRENRGIANGNVITVKALPYIISGHSLHHFKILREKYGVKF